MSDLSMDVLLSRLHLGLTPLDLNDGIGFKCNPTFLGGSVAYNRTTISSPYMDGTVTVDRQLQMVTEPVGVEIKGRTSVSGATSIARMHANHDALVDAIHQNDFTLTINVDGETWAYQCEASDYAMTWTGPRMMARQGTMTIQLLRQPVPLVGSS